MKIFKTKKFGWFTGGGFEKDPTLTTKDKEYYRAKLGHKEKELKAKSPFKIKKEKIRKMDWIEKDDQIVKNMERAAARHDKREIEGWLKAFGKEDRKELRRFEREMARD